MITDERQYQQTRMKLTDLETLIAATVAGEAGDEGIRDVQTAGLQSQAADLREELDEYETLRDGRTP